MVKSKRKNKRTRKQRGGVEPDDTGVKFFNKTTGQNVPEENQQCIESLKKNNRFNDIPIWTSRLIKGLPSQKRTKKEIQEAIKDTRWDERKKWCKDTKTGYCQRGKAWIHTTDEDKKRCLKPPNKVGFCEVDLNLLEWYHCTNSCGRTKKKEDDKLAAAKKKEAIIKCNDVRVKIRDKLFDKKTAASGRIANNEKIKKELKKKKDKEEAENKERIRKQKIEAERLATAAKKAQEEKEEAERKRVEKLRQKAEKERKKKVEEERKHGEEVKKRKHDKELKEKQDRNTKCINDIIKKVNDEGKEIMNIKWEEIDEPEEVQEVMEKLASINQLQRKLEIVFDKCIYEFPSMKNQLTAKIQNVGKKLMPLWERIDNLDQKIQKESSLGTHQLKNPENAITLANLKEWAPNRCRKKKPCKGEFCIGDFIKGQDIDGSSLSPYYYTGVVIGKKLNNIQSRTGTKYPIGYPAIYNYNSKNPYYSILVMPNKPNQRDVNAFTKWYDEYLQMHKIFFNQYPLAVIKKMIGRKMQVPKQLIKNIPCMFNEPHGFNKGGRKKKTCKRKCTKKKRRKRKRKTRKKRR